MRRISVLAIFVLLLMLNAAHADRIVWYVHPDSALNSIQAGLDSCADNDIVLVGPGTYYENIVWPNTQGIHLVSELGSEYTIIDGGNIDRAIMIASGVDSTTMIRGFSIQNGYHTNYGAGIYCDASSPIITDNIIRNNITNYIANITYGGGILCKGSSPIIKHNTITENLAVGSGAGIHCDSSSSPIITCNTIVENSLASVPYVTGGGIYCSFSSIIISKNTISDNWPEGIYCESSPSATISGNIISNNMRYGIYFFGVGSPCVLHNIIIGNDDAGIYCYDSASPIIDSCTISSNVGHGIWSRWGSNPTIHYCDIFDNEYYGVFNEYTTFTIDAEYNWWGDSTGPYHSDSNPGGLGDSVSDYVDFIPWLYWPGVEERPIVDPAVKQHTTGATIFAGPLILPAGKPCKVFDITGRLVMPDKIKPGIYFLEIEGKVVQKVIKIK